MDTVLITLSGLISIVSIVPYIIQILRGKVKPRLVSWFTWTLLTLLAMFASWSEGHIGATVQIGTSALATLIVLILGWRLGDRRIDRVDVACLAGVFVGLFLWWWFDSPAMAVLAAITVDLIGCIPTLIHSWRKPYEEAWITFAMGGVSAGLILITASVWTVTSVGYQVYLVVANALLVSFILLSPHRKLKGEPAELREL